MAAYPSDCEFCQIIHGIQSARIVCETDKCLAFFPLKPVVKGHTLVVPKDHFADFWSADVDILPALTLAVRVTGNAIMLALSPDGMNIINSAGDAASQTIYHLHVHVVPRWYGDRIGNIWPSGPVISAEELDGTAERIRSECGWSR